MFNVRISWRYMLFSPTASLMFNLRLATLIFSTWVNKEFISNLTRVGDCKSKRKMVLPIFSFFFVSCPVWIECVSQWFNYCFCKWSLVDLMSNNKRGCFLVKQKRDLVFHKDVYRFTDPFHNVARHLAKQSESSQGQKACVAAAGFCTYWSFSY